MLTRLPTNFYSMSEQYLRSQREEYNQAILIPHNSKTMMLGDLVKKIENRLKHIYEIRERKIALAALDSMGGSNAPENMTRKDKELYEHLVATLRSFREGFEPPEMPKPAINKEIVAPTKDIPKVVDVEKKVLEIPEKSTQTAPEKNNATPEPDNTQTPDSMIVHVLEDIPNFVGIDNTYDLRKDDMVTLPSQFANLLSSKGKVRIVEG